MSSIGSKAVEKLSTNKSISQNAEKVNMNYSDNETHSVLIPLVMSLNSCELSCELFAILCNF